MTTAVDTCVLLDLLLEEPLWAARAEEALRKAHALVNADRLLTRGARFYRQGMAGLTVMEP